MAERVFVGREAERERFEAFAAELIEAGGPRWARRSARRSAETGTPAGSPRVMLILGSGGSGKSSLLRQYRAMAATRARTAWLDWSQIMSAGSGPHPGLAELGLVKVLGAVQWAITDAFVNDEEFSQGRVAYEFRDYRSGADRMPEYVARVQEVVERAGRPGFPCTGSDAATLISKLESAGLAAVWCRQEAGDPAGEKVPPAAGPLSAVIVEAVTKRPSAQLPPQEYALVSDPALELTRRFAAAVSELARRRPLVIFLDAGEMLTDRAWEWLRLVMTGTAPRVAWVVAARSAEGAAADADSRIARLASSFDDRLVMVSPTPFDSAAISAYLQSRPAGRDCATQEIETIARCTGGLPLAVSLAATLLDDGATVAQACAGADDDCQGTASARLIHRYLAHARARLAQDDYPADDPRRTDAARIVALSLARGRPGDTDLLAALWGDSHPRDVLDDLASRHDFLVADSLWLHDDVRDGLREELLRPDQRQFARPASQRALNLSLARLTSMRERWPTLDEQLGHPQFASALLDAIWHATWVRNQEGIDLLAATLPVLTVAEPRVASMALAITERFTGTATPEQQQLLERFASQPPDSVPDNSSYGALIGQPGDREAAALLLRARRQAMDNRHQEAVASLEAALAATTSALLRAVGAGQALAIAAHLTQAGQDRDPAHAPAGLAAAEIAARLLPGSAVAWWCYGRALRQAGRTEDTLFAQRRALELYPDDAATVSGLGTTLLALGRAQEAREAFEQALALDPGNAALRNIVQ